MPIFQVAEYTVHVNRGGTGPSYRLLQLTSTALAHNIRHHAAIYFYDTPPAIGYVYNVDQPNFNGHYIVASFYKSDFWEMYDILRSERPVYLSYDYIPSGYDPTRYTRTLTSVWLSTGPEPPGEGPAEPAPALPTLMESMESSEERAPAEESMESSEERPPAGESPGRR